MQGRLFSTFRHNIWDKVFKNGPSKICGRQPLKNLKGHGLYKQITLRMFKGCLPQILLGPFLNALSHKLHLQSTHFKSIYIPFFYPLRMSKNLWFFMFSGDMEHWLKKKICKYNLHHITHVSQKINTERIPFQGLVY